jgi:hypothetical protein
MARPPLTFALRLSLRGARAALRTTRNTAELGLAALELVGRALGDEPGGGGPLRPARRAPGPPVATNGTGRTATAMDDLAAFAPDLAVIVEVDPEVEDDVWLDEIPPDIVYVDGDDSTSEPEAPDVELVEETAGASIHLAAPFAGYDALRAVDVIARLAGSDAATLGAIELYEQSHRRRRTVLDAIAREARRRG